MYVKVCWDVYATYKSSTFLFAFPLYSTGFWHGWISSIPNNQVALFFIVYFILLSTLFKFHDLLRWKKCCHGNKINPFMFFSWKDVMEFTFRLWKPHQSKVTSLLIVSLRLKMWIISFCLWPPWLSLLFLVYSLDCQSFLIHLYNWGDTWKYRLLSCLNAPFMELW